MAIAIRGRILRHRKRRWILTGVIVVAALALALAAVGWAQGWWIATTPVGTPPPAAAALTPNERAYYDYVAPRLRSLVAETTTLDRLGAEKSRNLFVLERGYNRVTDLIKQIGNYQQLHGVPPRFAVSQVQYAAGTVQVQQAMNQAQNAFLHFQWDKVAKARTVFDQGTKSLAQSVATLDREGGHVSGAPATPTTRTAGVVSDVR